MSKILKLWNLISVPDYEYSVIPVWILKNEVSKDIANSMFSECVENDIHRIVIKPEFDDIDTVKHVSKEYFNTIKNILSTARMFDIKVIIYDDILTTYVNADKNNIEQRDILVPMNLSANTQVEEYITSTCDKYYDELKEYFGNTIIGFYVDAKNPTRENKKENELTKIDTKTYTNSFYKKMYEWCEKHYIELIGHPENDESITQAMNFNTFGQDVIIDVNKSKADNLNTIKNSQIKLTADIAKCLKKRRNLNMCFNKEEKGKHFKDEDVKAYINHLAINGVNMFLYYGFYSTINDITGMYNIDNDKKLQFTKYINRLSYILTDYTNNARVAVVCEDNKVPSEELALLCENQIEFNYIPANMLLNGFVNEKGNYELLENEYEVVINLIGSDEKYITGSKIIRSVDELTQYVQSAKKVLKAQASTIRYMEFCKSERKLHMLVNEGDKEEVISLNNKSGLLGIELKLWNEEARVINLDSDITIQPSEVIVLIEFATTDREKINSVVKELNKKKNNIYVSQ